MEKATASKNINLLIISVGLLFALPVFPSNVKSIVIAFFLLAVLLRNIRVGFHFDKRFFITNGALFLMLAATFLYSEDSAYAVRKLSTMASLFVFPMAFALINSTDREQLHARSLKFLWVYLVAVTALNVIPFMWFYITHYTFDQMMIHYPTVMRVDAGKWNIHPIYLSMHASIAILFGFYILKNTKSRIKIITAIVLILTLILFLFLYAKKGPMLALIAVFTLFILFQDKGKWMKIYVFAIIGFVALTLLIPRTRQKLIELQKIETLQEGVVTSTNIRYTIYGIAQQLIKESPLIGYGIGDYNTELDAQYKALDDEVLIQGSYNAHNQYFSIMLIGGVLCLFVLLVMMGMNLIFAIRYNNQLLILVLIFYGIVMLTENILERENGVIFFAIFLNYFTSKSLFTNEK